ADAHFALQDELATGLLDDAMHHRQPEASALADALGGEERLGGALQRLLVHAGTGVDRGDADIATGGKAQLVALEQRRLMRAEDQRPALRHRVARVEREVEQ